MSRTWTSTVALASPLPRFVATVAKPTRLPSPLIAGRNEAPFAAAPAAPSAREARRVVPVVRSRHQAFTVTPGAGVSPRSVARLSKASLVPSVLSEAE